MRRGLTARFGRAASIALLGALIIAGAGAQAWATGDPGLRVVPVATGLPGSVFVVPAPSGLSGRLYVVQRTGIVRIVDKGRLLPKPFLDIHTLVQSGGLRGMFSLAFHPDYRTNGRFFVNYVGRGGDIYVAQFRSVSGVGAPSSRRVLIHVTTPRKDAYGHYGGQLAFGPDGRLYASFGDGNEPETAQDPSTLLGKLVRLDVDTAGAEPEIVADGLRNAWRFSFDRPTGDLYIGDVGDHLREEVDRLPAGFSGIANFGWPIWEGSVHVHPAETAGPGRILPPLIEYWHAPKRCNSITSGLVYRGGLRRLSGRYVYGDLCGGAWSVSVKGGVARDRRSEPIAPPGLLVSFGEGARGKLYVVALSGRIYEVR